MKTILIGLFLLIFLFQEGEAQIPILNPSFEGKYTVGNLPDGVLSVSVYIEDWKICNQTLGILNPALDSQLRFPKFVSPNLGYLDSNFLTLECSDHLNGLRLDAGSVCQKVSCNLIVGKTYRMGMALTSLYNSIDTTIQTYAYPQVWLGSDSCTKSQLIYTRDTLPYKWGYYSFSFTPQNTYSYIYLDGRYFSSSYHWSLLGIDAISPIYPLNAHAVAMSGSSNDTLVKKGACVNMHATTTINTYDSVYWLRLRGTTLDTLNRNSFSLQDCVEQATTYIVCMHDSVADCAGKWWSSDTMRVGLFPTGIAELEEGGNIRFVLYPNPSDGSRIVIESSQEGELIIVNTLGQWIKKEKIQKGNNILLNPEAPLSAGVYSYLFVSKQGEQKAGKYIVN